MFARNIGYNCHCARGQQLCPRVGVIRKRQRSCERVTSHAVELPRAVAVDVEYAHFSVCGRVQTAAAEVCLVREDCSIVLEGFVCPGKRKASLRQNWCYTGDLKIVGMQI